MNCGVQPPNPPTIPTLVLRHCNTQVFPSNLSSLFCYGEWSIRSSWPRIFFLTRATVYKLGGHGARSVPNHFGTMPFRHQVMDQFDTSTVSVPEVDYFGTRQSVILNSDESSSQ